MSYVYGEVVFIENFLINYIILKISSDIMKNRTKRIRLILGALLGAGYALIQYAYPVFTKYPFKIALSVVIILISFSPMGFKNLTNQLLTFYGISLLFGGCVIGLIILRNKSSDMTLTIYGVRSTTVVIGILLGIVTVVKIRAFIIESRLKSKSMVDIRAYVDGKSILVKGFVDTGCNVVEPLTGKPVLLVEYDAVKEVLPQEICSYYAVYEGQMDGDMDLKIHNKEVLGKMRFVPFSTVSSQGDTTMLGYQFDRVELGNGQDWHVVEKICVGLCNRRLSEDCEFKALINPKLLYMGGGL